MKFGAIIGPARALRRPEMVSRAHWPWPTLTLLAAVALAMWMLKRHYAAAEVDELSWILSPVARLSAWLSGVRFEWEPGSGYLSRERLFVIAKPCAGVNFMLAALGMVGWLLSKRAVSFRASAALTALSLGIAYAASILANTTRIVVALWLTTHPVTTRFWTAARVHRLEGIVVYFGILVLLHLVVERLASSRDAMNALERATVPLFAYYLVTVLVPLANGSGALNRGFIEHMAFVVLGPLTLVGLFGLARHVARRTTRSIPPHVV